MPHAHVEAKAIVAFSRPGVIDYWLSQDLPLYTKNTVNDPDQLRKIYDQIRKTGIAYDYAEYVEKINANAIGAPVFNHENEPVAGVAIAVLSQRRMKS